MLKALVFDLYHVLLFVKGNRTYDGSFSVIYDRYHIADLKAFLEHYDLNTEILELARTLSPNFSRYVFTAGSMYQLPEMKVVLDDVFAKTFSATELGSKSDPATYHALCAKIQCKPNEVLFIDDSEANSTAARAAGLHSITYASNRQLKDELKRVHQIDF